eukprot:4489205-Amphidinium_carterae.1
MQDTKVLLSGFLIALWLPSRPLDVPHLSSGAVRKDTIHVVLTGFESIAPPRKDSPWRIWARVCGNYARADPAGDAADRVLMALIVRQLLYALRQHVEINMSGTLSHNLSATHDSLLRGA